MAQMYVYRRKADDFLESIPGICNARPEADYDRFPVSRAELGDRSAMEAYSMDGDSLVLKPTASLSADKLTITADGANTATVTVSIDPAQSMAGVEVTAEGTPATVDLAGGTASFPVTASTTGTIEIAVTDSRLYAPDTLTITAQ